MIPFHQSVPQVSEASSFPRSLVAALPRTYAIVFYSTDTRFGWVMLGMSLLVPQVGLFGLAGVVLAAGIAWMLGFSRMAIRSGFLLFNPLLSCSAVGMLGWTSGWPVATTLSLWAAAAGCSLMLTSAMQGWIATRVGLSVQSLPSVIVVALLYYTGIGSAGTGWVLLDPSWSQVSFYSLPGVLRSFFVAFAAIAFQSSELVGLLIFIGFALSSPLGALMATVGYFSGAATFYLLGLPGGLEGTAWCGYNFLLAGIALGAGYHVPNRSSITLAGAGAALTAMASIALGSMLSGFALGPGALPYNLVVLSIVAALRLVRYPGGLVASPWTTLQPEGVARLVQINQLRFPDFYQPALFLPCAVETVITQGFNGKITHRGPWKHALDFEAQKTEVHGLDGNENNLGSTIFNTPVYAPTTGAVVGIENHIVDNRLGHNNPESNWGNHVIIRSDTGLHVMLAHLRHGSVAVVPGQHVAAGAMLGKCGNSGRSPVPHLHLHAQFAAHRGAPTVPFVLKHFVERTGDGGPSIYRLSGVPQERWMVRPAQPSAALHACFTGWLPGIYKYELHGEDEALHLDFDEAGRFRLRSKHHDECLILYLAEGVLYAEPCSGRSCELLRLLSIVLARVPCIDEPSVIWYDFISAVPFLTGPKRLLHDVCDPFLSAAVLRYQYSISALTESFQIAAELQDPSGCAPSTPRFLRAEVRGRNAVVALNGEALDGTPIRARLKEYSLPT